MERIGQLLAGRAGTIPPGEPNPEADRRIAAVIARVDSLRTRVEELEHRQDHADDRMADFEHDERRRGDG